MLPDPRGIEKPASAPVSASGTYVLNAPITESAPSRPAPESAVPFDSAEYLQFVLQSVRMGTWDWNFQTHTVTVSRETRAVYGVPDSPAIATREQFAALIHPDDRPWIMQSLDQVLAGQSHYRAEFRIAWPDGSVHWIEHWGHAYMDEAGKPSRMIGTCMDITGRKQAEEKIYRLTADLERRVAERTEQLEAANQELEAFVYSVSHDLRAPLRGIDGFSLAIIEDAGDRLDNETCEALAIIRAETQRMGQLIDDLLNLSRVTRSAMRREPVNLSEMAASVGAALAQRDPKRRVSFAIAPNLMVSADARLLQIALENLLGNAWKFTVGCENAVIEVGSEQNGSETIYFVRDNGAGFDMAYADKLFGAFQRLHTTSEFAGTGIGLTTVQRVILRHEGQVWAESRVGRGAVFFFTLPAPLEIIKS